jgi:hypothetical protein
MKFMNQQLVSHAFQCRTILVSRNSGLFLNTWSWRYSSELGCSFKLIISEMAVSNLIFNWSDHSSDIAPSDLLHLSDWFGLHVLYIYSRYGLKGLANILPLNHQVNQVSLEPL